MCILHIGSYVFILEVFVFSGKMFKKELWPRSRKKTSKTCAPGDHSEHLKLMKIGAGESRNRKTNPKSEFFEDAILRRFLALPKSAQNSKKFVYRATAPSCHQALALSGERKGRTKTARTKRLEQNIIFGGARGGGRGPGAARA